MNPQSHWSRVSVWFGSCCTPPPVTTGDRCKFNTLFRGLGSGVSCEVVSPWLHFRRDQDHQAAIFVRIPGDAHLFHANSKSLGKGRLGQFLTASLSYLKTANGKSSDMAWFRGRWHLLTILLPLVVDKWGKAVFYATNTKMKVDSWIM